MSSTRLCRTFGLRDYRVVRTVREGEALALHLEQTPEHDRCSACQSNNAIRRGSVERTIRTVPMGDNAVDLHLAVRRVG